MEGRVWKIVCAYLPKPESTDGRTHCDLRSIVMILLWAALNNRARNWALKPANWTVSPRPLAFLSEGQFSRRASSALVKRAFDELLQAVNSQLADDSSVAIADGSPVLVGGASRDRDAKAGRAVGGFGRGYKLHLVATPQGCIHALRITSLNANEGKQLIEMAAEVPDHVTRILADGAYDSSEIHRRLDSQSIRLIAPVRNDRVGRRQDPYRLATMKYLRSPRGKHCFKQRSNIERLFGNFKSHPLGLQGLPTWVRRIHRVQLWILAKLTCWLATKILKQQKPSQ